MNLGSLIVGMVVGILIVFGAVVALGYSGAPTPSDVCHNQLGDDWEPNGVQTDRGNNTVYITCQASNGTTERVSAELNVMDDVLGESS